MIETVDTHGDLASAERALSQPGSAYFGGGTLVMRAVNYNKRGVTRLVRSTDPALRERRISHDSVTLGAGLCMSELLADRELAFLHPALRAVGGPAIRQAATVGGNLCARQPWGDLGVMLLALDAQLLFAGERTPGMSLESFLQDRHAGAQARSAQRLISAVTFTRPRDLSCVFFRKVQRVKPKGTSLMTLAAHVPSGGAARVALGNLCAITKRSPGAERALKGGRLDSASIARAAEDLLEGFDPPTDALASGWYRREVAPVHFRRALESRR